MQDYGFFRNTLSRAKYTGIFNGTVNFLNGLVIVEEYNGLATCQITNMFLSEIKREF